MKILHGKTDIGRRRKVNQDTFAVLSPSADLALCVVCDGMGGAVGGAEASRLACDTFCETVSGLMEEIEEISGAVCSDAEACAALRRRLAGCIPDSLCDAVNAANAAVFAAAEQDHTLQGMGTTLVALFCWEDYACAVNVGDSRLYAVTDDEIRQLSRDHSYVQYLIDMGKLTAEEAKQSSNRNIITRAVGTAADLDCDIIDIPPELAKNATFLLCSDGLSGMVEDGQMAEIIRGEGSAEEKVDALVDRANAAGGTDNITVVLCRR